MPNGDSGHFFKDQLTGSRTAGLRTISPPQWAGKPIPERKWLVEGLIPAGAVTMISGDGGLGKSLLSLQLMTCCATQKDFLGRQTANVKSLGVFCEDEYDELHYRMSCITRHYGVDYGDLSDIGLISRVGWENSLMDSVQEYRDGVRSDQLHDTQLYHQIWNTAVESGAQLVVLDSLHDMFAGNENERKHARHFIGLLRRLALEIDGAVIINAHPSVAGMASGSGSAGSTAWNNAVRSRLYLTRDKDKDGEEADQDARILKTMKANYGRAGDKINLKYEDGVFVTVGAPTGISWLDGHRDVSAVLDALRALQTQMVAVSLYPSQPTYAPKLFRSMAGVADMKPARICEIMSHLITKGTVSERVIGRKENRHPILSLVDTAQWKRQNETV